MSESADEKRGVPREGLGTDGSRIVENNFSDESVGPYTDDDFKSDLDWGKVRWAHFYGRAEIVNDDGDKKRRLTFPTGKFGHAETGGYAAIPIGLHNKIYHRFAAANQLMHHDRHKHQAAATLATVPSQSPCWQETSRKRAEQRFQSDEHKRLKGETSP